MLHENLFSFALRSFEKHLNPVLSEDYLHISLCSVWTLSQRDVTRTHRTMSLQNSYFLPNPPVAERGAGKGLSNVV